MHVAAVVKLPVLQQGHTLQSTVAALQRSIYKDAAGVKGPHPGVQQVPLKHQYLGGRKLALEVSITKYLYPTLQLYGNSSPSTEIFEGQLHLISPCLQIGPSVHCTLYSLGQMQAYLIAMGPIPLPLLIMKFILKAHLRRRHR